MNPRRLPYPCLLVACLLSLVSAQQPAPSVQTSREGGAQTIAFKVGPGRVRVTLPDDMAAGDTISGTVITQAAGGNQKERELNASELSGYVIELGNQKSPVSGGVIRNFHIPEATSVQLLILFDANGKQIGLQPLLVQPAGSAAVPATLNLPRLGQVGRPIQIPGAFDGNSANTSAKVGDSDAKVIAESPRQVVVESPRDVVGQSQIKVNENGTATAGAFRNLKIDLTAPKTSLLRGESTELHVQVQGLEGLSQPVQVQLQNLSPSNVNLSGGNIQTIPIQPSAVTGGSFNWSGTVTGVAAGGFNMTGSVAGTSAAPTVPTATTVPPAQPVATPSPAPSTTPRTSPQVYPTPANEERFNNSYTKVDTDCCKKFLNDGVFVVSDGKGNEFKIFENKLSMKIDGKEYEWEFTQDGKPFYIEWMFCHLNDNMIISQNSQVTIQQVKGANSNASGNTTNISLHGPQRDQKSRRPTYGFQFGAQKTGSDNKEYGISFSMDAEFCAWSCQLIAEGKVEEFRTNPARPPDTIFNGINNSTGIPSGAAAYQQQAWWNAMYSYLFEIEDWYLWINNASGGDLDVTNRAYNAWRIKLVNALGEMRKSAAPEDLKRIDEMLDLLKNTNPSPEAIKEIERKFDSLHLRYGTKLPPNIRNQLLDRVF
jgi:hypothetical protein